MGPITAGTSGGFVSPGASTGILSCGNITLNASLGAINGTGGNWPDGGQLAFNTLTNTGPRQTDKPVALLDLVGASDWRVEDNWVNHFVKTSGNGVAYGLFMKGAGEGGRIERILVVCTANICRSPMAEGLMRHFLRERTDIAILSLLALSAYLVLLVGRISFGQQAYFALGAYACGMASTLAASGRLRR